LAAKKTAAVHRPLRNGDTGADTTAVQKAAQKVLDNFKIDYDIIVDGEYGPQTNRGVRMAAIGMGALAKNRAALAAGRCPESAQRLVRGTRHKTKAERRATKRRRSYRLRMRKRWTRTLGEKALDVARTLIGVMEQGGNNTGPIVDKIIRANSGTIGEPWCGDFVAFAYRIAGSKLVQRLWASVYYLGQLAGINKVAVPRPGDLVRFTFDHVGLFEKDLGNGSIQTIEGNTGASGAVSDSSTGGDGVYRKVRAKSLVNDYRRVSR
jgi:hypothetical protein